MDELKSAAADRLVLSALDDVAWMLNVRGSDVHCNPVAISYLTVDKSGAVNWFIHASKVSG
jgi:Xaa-Pro aminopeptidase